jgi:hypothetical protein
MINGKPHPHGLHIGTEPGALSSDFTMGPVDEAVTQTFGILAKKGGGKSYTASVVAEEILKNGRRICVFDPTGAWWGLRSSATGRSDGYPVVIFGGLHADIPLNPARGRELGEFVAAPGPSIIIDVSDIRKGQLRSFAADFFEALYEGKNRQREPIHLFVDEADLVAPQRVMGEEARMVGAVEDIVRRGRIRGLGVTLITQRSAVINWDVLSQIDTLIALRTTAPLDRKRMAEWVADHDDTGTAKQAVRELDRLPIGVAWVWSPGWLQRLVRIEVRKRDTFDSGATPKGGVPVAAPTATAKVDLAAIRASMEAAFAEAEANDPKKLKARITELERALSSKAQVVEVEKIVEKPVLQGPELARLGEISKETVDLVERIERAVGIFSVHVGVLADAVFRATAKPVPSPLPARPAAASMAAPAPVAARGPSVAPTPTNGVSADTKYTKAPTGEADIALAKVERAILTVLAQWPEGRSQAQVCILSDYSATAGGFRNGLSRLRTAGLIEGPGTALRITEAGRAAIGEIDPVPSGEPLFQWWVSNPVLGRAERAILATLYQARGGEMSQQAVGEATNYSPTAGGFRNALSKLRTLRVIEGPGAGMRISADML